MHTTCIGHIDVVELIMCIAVLLVSRTVVYRWCTFCQIVCSICK